MRQWIGQLDRILRGEATQVAALEQGHIAVSARGLTVVLAVLAMVYGVCMGCFAMTRGTSDAWAQVAAGTLKMPALFFFTLVVTFPSLYVFNALMGSRLTLLSLLRLLVAAVGVMVAVLASFGTIVAFFSFTTTSYPFMVFLNVIACAIAGVLGLRFLLQTLNRLTVALAPRATLPPLLPEVFTPEGEEGEEGAEGVGPGEEQRGARLPGALDMPQGHVLGQHVKTVFYIWVLVFALVGAQMSWVLRDSPRAAQSQRLAGGDWPAGWGGGHLRPGVWRADGDLFGDLGPTVASDRVFGREGAAAAGGDVCGGAAEFLGAEPVVGAGR